MRKLTPLKVGDKKIRGEDFNAAFEEIERLGRMGIIGGESMGGPSGHLLSVDVDEICIARPCQPGDDIEYPSPPEVDEELPYQYPMRAYEHLKFHRTEASAIKTGWEQGLRLVNVYNLAERGWIHQQCPWMLVWKWNEMWWTWYDPPRRFELDEKLVEFNNAYAYELFPKDGKGEAAATLGLNTDEIWRKGGEKVLVYSDAAHHHGGPGYFGMYQRCYDHPPKEPRDASRGWNRVISMVQKARFVMCRLEAGVVNIKWTTPYPELKVLEYWEGIDPRRPVSQESDLADKRVKVRNLFHSDGPSIVTACYVPEADVYHCLDQTCKGENLSGYPTTLQQTVPEWTQLNDENGGFEPQEEEEEEE